MVEISLINALSFFIFIIISLRNPLLNKMGRETIMSVSIGWTLTESNSSDLLTL